MKTDKQAKQRIIEAAMELFYHQGYSQTSVREIAGQASVNQALISYYFGHKKGLLEQIMVHFYEEYFETIEMKYEKLMQQDLFQKERLLAVLQHAFDYLFASYQMTRLIYRELSLDSTLIREVMTLYLSREKYFYLSLLERASQASELEEEDLDMMVLQLLHMLYMPFLQPQMIREVYYVEPHSDQFKHRYFLQLNKWVENHFRSH